MLRTSGWVTALLLAAGNMAYAEDLDTRVVDIGTDRDQWQRFDPRMTSDDYMKISRNNLRMARRALTSYSHERLTSLWVPEMGINVLGTAIGLATSTARFHVNKSKTVAVEFDSLAEEERALTLKVKIDW